MKRYQEMDQQPHFRGYSLPTSNTTYTPNQFFDVVLRHGSRGVVRLVAFMIRKTLGWSDENGLPQETEVHFSYRQLEQTAGIGHSMIRSAIDEAVKARYIRCIQAGVVNKPGVMGNPSLYELNWDERDQYITDPTDFAGFYAKNGNLTYIPNDFFDYAIPTETLALVRVVGAIIRYTIGFQTRFGLRRQKIAMSITGIQRKTGIKGRQHVIQALRAGIAGNHIVRLEMGFFDPEAGKDSHPAVYGIKWLDTTASIEIASQRGDTPKRLPRTPDTPKRIPGRSENVTEGRTEKVTGERTEKVTDIEITVNNTSINNNNRSSTVREASLVAVGVADVLDSSSANSDASEILLKEIGFDQLTARRLAAENSGDVIRQQLAWLPKRNSSRNRLGMLRRAIEEDWPAPVVADASHQSAVTEGSDSPARHFAANFYAGWAGNPGRSAAPPSANDLNAAEPFVQMLLDVSSDPSQAGSWGREFGTYARKMEQDNRKAFGSLVYALRTQGDSFFVSWRERQKQQIAKTSSAAIKAHKERYNEQYQTYLRARHEEIRIDEPEAYLLFSTDEDEQRNKFKRGMFANSKGALLILEMLDREKERLQRFWEFFQKDDLPSVLDFWEWDKRMNPDRFDARENL